MSDWTTEEKKKLNGLTFSEPTNLTDVILSEPTVLQSNKLLGGRPAPGPSCDTSSTTLNKSKGTCTCKAGYVTSSDPLKCTANCNTTTTTLNTTTNVCVCNAGNYTVTLSGNYWTC